ncbi:MAG: COX15/CtaA family protein [Algoriphagus sp.]|jgi:cytochrome c oxidase assembly protein subunit 15|nr:COX15/CtaA family protein [Algoriphagus sp.]
MNQSTKRSLDSFRRISLITVIAVYFLILVGGVVRSTGSGMGCPDWPKCFGSVIPPTSVNQLPKNYQEIYLQQRLAKNERFVATIEKLGFKETAKKIAEDKSILVEEEFNATKTWIEYINRLIGVVIGLLILATLWKSWNLRFIDKWITLNSLIALILVLFTGWIGSIVVSTNLLPWMITFHMLLALALVSFLIYANYRASRLLAAKNHLESIPSKVKIVLLFGMFLMLIQVVLGTQVREKIDLVSNELGGLLREEWINRVGISFLIHRSFSLVLLATLLLYFIWVFKYTQRRSSINQLSILLMIVLIVEIVSGVGMAYFGIPPFLQPIHLVLGSIILGIQLQLVLRLKSKNSKKLTVKL